MATTMVTDAPVMISLDSLYLPDILRPGDCVMWSQGASEPTPLVSALADQIGELDDIAAFLTVSYSDILDGRHADKLTIRGLGGLGSYRQFATRDGFDIVPVNYSSIPQLIACGDLRVDVFFVQVAPPDAEGTGEYNLGTDCGFALAALESSRLTVAEVNQRMPRTHGSTAVGAHQLDFAVSTNRALVHVDPGVPSEKQLAVAANVASLISIGDTIQLGIGGVPSAVPRTLIQHEELGIHSGILNDGMCDLITSGIATNSRKTVDTGISVATTAVGTDSLYSFVEKNAEVNFRPSSYTHSPAVLARIDNFVAINSAVQVDLTGQVNAEYANNAYLGAVGGHADFSKGAVLSSGGRSIVALESTTRDGRHSRVVSRLSAGIVTTPRSDVDFVVTEHGVAQLRGKSIRERSRAMVSIADPRQREALIRDSRMSRLHS